MVSRYSNRKIGVNSTEQYGEFLEDRGLKKIRQYFSPNLRHPTNEETTQLSIVRQEWKVGDRFYKLADKHYGDSKLWWVIAHYNQKPTEAHMNLGDIVEVPFPLELVLRFLGV